MRKAFVVAYLCCSLVLFVACGVPAASLDGVAASVPVPSAPSLPPAGSVSVAEEIFSLAQGLDVLDEKCSLDVFPAGMAYEEYSLLDAVICQPMDNGGGFRGEAPQTLVLYGANGGYEAFECGFNPRSAGKYYEGPMPFYTNKNVAVNIFPTEEVETYTDGTPVVCQWANKKLLTANNPMVPSEILLFGTDESTADYTYFIDAPVVYEGTGGTA